MEISFKELYSIIKEGGPYAITTLALVWGYFERKERQGSQKNMFELATRQIEANLKLEASVTALKDVLMQISNRI